MAPREATLGYTLDGGGEPRSGILEGAATDQTIDHFRTTLFWSKDQIIATLVAADLIPDPIEEKENNDRQADIEAIFDDLDVATVNTDVSIDDAQFMAELEAMPDNDEPRAPFVTFPRPETQQPFSEEDQIKDDNWMVTVDLRREEIAELVFYHASRADWWKCNGLDPQGGADRTAREVRLSNRRISALDRHLTDELRGKSRNDSSPCERNTRSSSRHTSTRRRKT